MSHSPGACPGGAGVSPPHGCNLSGSKRQRSQPEPGEDSPRGCSAVLCPRFLTSKIALTPPPWHAKS